MPELYLILYKNILYFIVHNTFISNIMLSVLEKEKLNP